MKVYLVMSIFVLIFFNFQDQVNDHKEISISNPFEIKGANVTSFKAEPAQKLVFIAEADTLFAEVIRMENHLCPSNPGIHCITQGYIIISLALNYHGGKDTLELKHGLHPEPDFWRISKDSIAITSDNSSVLLFLNNAAYYTPLKAKKKDAGVHLTMGIRNIKN